MTQAIESQYYCIGSRIHVPLEMTYLRMLGAFHIHNVIGAADMYEVCVTFASDVSAWTRNFNQYFFTAEIWMRSYPQKHQKLIQILSKA